MAYRQYIGARYVPLYDGHWDSTKNYEPLTIVDDANGNSYTSKKDVPAGTALTNTEYWILTSSFSGAVAQLQNRVTALEAEDVALHEKDAELEQKDTELENAIVNIQEGLAEKWVIISDSYGEGYSPDGSTTPFHQIIKSRLGLTEENMTTRSYGGAGFAHANNDIKFETLLDGIISNMTFENRSKVTRLMVIGGTNDRNETKSDILNAMNAFISKARGAFVNAKIYIGFCGHASDAEMALKFANVCITTYTECVRYGAMYIANLEYVLCDNNLMSSDKMHPNQVGQTVIAGSIIEGVLGAGIDFARQKFIGITATNGMSFNAQYMDVFKYNGITQIKAPAFFTATCSNIMFGYDGWTDIGNLVNADVLEGNVRGNCHCLVYVDNVWHGASGEWRLMNGKLQLHIWRTGTFASQIRPTQMNIELQDVTVLTALI